MSWATMTRWHAVGPVSLRMQCDEFSYDDIYIRRYSEEQLNKLLGNDIECWSPVHFSVSYKAGFWLKLAFDVKLGEDSWKKAVSQTSRFLVGLGLFKTTLSMLAVAGLSVKRREKGSGPSGHFGWETTLVGKPYYFLKKTEIDNFRAFLSKYIDFWNNNKVINTDKQLQRINIATNYFQKAFQTTVMIERHIFLSVALEALYGEESGELQYRYSNRAALLLGDDINTRKTVFKEVLEAYKTRSSILHGGLRWMITRKGLLNYIEIIRQSILRCISLYSKGYGNIAAALDGCLHDPDEHANMLENARALFGIASEYKEPGKAVMSRGWALRK